MARHRGGRCDRGQRQQRPMDDGHRLGGEDPAGARARQVRRPRFGHHRRHRVGRRPRGAWRAAEPDAGARDQPEPRRRRRLRRRAIENVRSPRTRWAYTRAIIAAAGNESDDVASHTPANCPGSTRSRRRPRRAGSRGTATSAPASTISAPGGQYRTGGSAPRASSCCPTPARRRRRPTASPSRRHELRRADGVRHDRADAGGGADLTVDQVHTSSTSTVKPFPGRPRDLRPDAMRRRHPRRRRRRARGRRDRDAAHDRRRRRVLQRRARPLFHHALPGRAGEPRRGQHADPVEAHRLRVQGGRDRAGRHVAGMPLLHSARPRATRTSSAAAPPSATRRAQNIRRSCSRIRPFMHMTLPAAGACPAGTTPIYRVFSNRAGRQPPLHDRSRGARPDGREGWIAEGDGPDLVVMCAPG